MTIDYLRYLGGLFVNSFIALFVIVSPLANIFSFLALTQGYGLEQQRETARRSCLTAFLLLAGFLFGGQYLLEFFGITLPAFQIAGGLLLFLDQPGHAAGGTFPSPGYDGQPGRR